MRHNVTDVGGAYLRHNLPLKAGKGVDILCMFSYSF